MRFLRGRDPLIGVIGVDMADEVSYLIHSSRCLAVSDASILLRDMMCISSVSTDTAGLTHLVEGRDPSRASVWFAMVSQSPTLDPRVQRRRCGKPRRSGEAEPVLRLVESLPVLSCEVYCALNNSPSPSKLGICTPWFSLPSPF